MQVERVQTGVRLEKRMLKVLKGLAAYLDMSMGGPPGGHRLGLV